MEKRLLTAREFSEIEPALGSKWAIDWKIREGYFGDCIVRIGRRAFIDPAKWEKLKENGGIRQAEAA
jgi:hypothetical protein